MGINKKGSGTIFAILIALAFFMFGMIFINFIMDEVTRTRDADNLNCASPDTDGDKIVCLIADATVPIFIIGVVAAIGAYLSRRFLWDI